MVKYLKKLRMRQGLSLELCKNYIIFTDKAEKQDVAGGQKMIQLSYAGRMIGVFAVLVLLAKSGFFHPLPLVLPLAFTRPILTVREWIVKRGGVST